MIYAGRIVITHDNKLRARIEIGDELRDFKILKEALKELKSKLIAVANVKHEGLFYIEVDKKGKKVAVPGQLKIAKEVAESSPDILKILKGMEMIPEEVNVDEPVQSFEEFSQQNWTDFIAVLKKEFGSKLPGYARLEEFCKANYTGPVSKKLMS